VPLRVARIDSSVKTRHRRFFESSDVIRCRKSKVFGDFRNVPVSSCKPALTPQVSLRGGGRALSPAAQTQQESMSPSSTSDFFDIRSKSTGERLSQPGQVRFPSWDNVEASLFAFWPGVKRSRPELFAVPSTLRKRPRQPLCAFVLYPPGDSIPFRRLFVGCAASSL
jgi:hypothetical protein